MSVLFSWIREKLSPEVTPNTRRKRSNAWLGTDGNVGNDGGEREERGRLAVAGTCSGNAEVRNLTVLCGCRMLVSMLTRLASYPCSSLHPTAVHAQAYIIFISTHTR